jgi:hypothetical protein
VAWTLPPQDAEGIDVRFTPGEAGELDVEVTSVDDEAGPRNFYRTILRLVSPDLEPTQTVLEQVGPGRYAGTVRADEPGAYLVRVAQTFEDSSGTDAASRTLGVVSPAAEEYRRLGVDADALRAYASAGRGRELPLEPEDGPTPSPWDRGIEASAFPTPIWPWLLLLAILLVPIDVGVRRVALSGADVRRARAWLARRVGLGRPAPEAVPGLAELRAARERSARRSARPVEAVDAPVAEASASATSPPPPSPARRPRPPRPAADIATDPTPPPAPEPAVEPAGETLAERLARRRRGG